MAASTLWGGAVSVNDPLTDADEQLLAHLDEQSAAAEDPAEYEAIIDALRLELRAHKAEFRQFKREVTTRIEQVEAEQATTNPDTGTQTDLAMLAQLSPDVWADQLSTSKVIALTLHTNWETIAWSMGDASHRKRGVDTKTKANAKYNPSRLKYRLQKELGWEPEWEQIYRGLKRLVQLSDGEEYVKDSGRVQVVGDAYIYEEKATPDGKQTKRVVWEVPE